MAATHSTVDIGGPVHVADYGGVGTPIVCVHGLGGSATNWMAVGPGLTEHGRVLAIDLPGFGRTPAAGRTISMRGFQQFVARFLREHVDEPAVLFGNSMGGAVALVQAAVDPEWVQALVLVDPAQPRPPGGPIDWEVAKPFLTYALPGLGGAYVERRRRELTPEEITREVLELCCVDPTRVPADVVAAGIETRRHTAAQPDSAAAFVKAARSLMATLAFRRRVEKMEQTIRAPALIVHGAQDRLVSLAAIEHLHRVRPDWDLHVFEDAGHVPQLEVPEAFLAVVGGWLARTLERARGEA